MSRLEASWPAPAATIMRSISSGNIDLHLDTENDTETKDDDSRQHVDVETLNQIKYVKHIQVCYRTFVKCVGCSVCSKINS